MTTRSEVRCVELVETVTDWMEDGLADDDRLLLEGHLVSCPHCTGYVAQLRATRAALGVDGGRLGTAPPAPARAALLAAFRSATRT
jgi:anti-sigma factor RsiW